MDSFGAPASLKNSFRVKTKSLSLGLLKSSLSRAFLAPKLLQESCFDSKCIFKHIIYYNKSQGLIWKPNKPSKLTW